MLLENNYNFDDYTTIAIIGQKGSGKTEAMKRMFKEQDGKSVFFDITGKTKISGKNILYISTIQKPDFEEIKGIFNLWSKKKYNKIILDVSALSSKQLVIYADFFFSKLMKEKIKCSVYIDEIAEYTPQTKLKSEQTIKMIRIGRNYDIRPVIFATQRPQQVAKNILALADCYIIMRVVYPNDLDVVSKIIGCSKQPEIQNKIKGFEVRECMIWGYKNNAPIYAKIRKNI